MIRDKIKYFCLIILFGVISTTCTKRYISSNLNVQKEVYSQMLADNSKTIAVLDTTYRLDRTRLLRKMGGITIDQDYEITYTFHVDNKIYTGVHKFEKLPTYQEVEVYYNKSNPSINTLNLNKSVQKVDSNHSFNLAMGILFAGLSLYFLYQFVSLFRNSIPKRISR